MEVSLRKEFFLFGNTKIVQNGALCAELFRYDTGICAVRLSNSRGFITVLPYNGQMIWEAFFCGRSLKMRTQYDDPRNVDSFIDTYGCYLMHCGALAMGCPGPQDTHRQHGDLPYARYHSAGIVSGEDEKGSYIGVTGIYEHNRVFGDIYLFRPEVRIYQDSAIIDIFVKIENLSPRAMEMMYLCHINNRAVTMGRIVQPIPWDAGHMKLRRSYPATVKPDEGSGEFLSKIAADVKTTEIIREGDAYDPEAVYYMQGVRADEAGWAHFLFVHPDGSADYTAYKPQQLDHCTRWIVKSKYGEALGLALPATADADGYTAEKQKGNIKQIPPQGSFSAEIKAGLLESAEAKKVEKKIESIMNG